jgi:hypothetical protein
MVYVERILWVEELGLAGSFGKSSWFSQLMTSF